jgi:hypothetical protein
MNMYLKYNLNCANCALSRYAMPVERNTTPNLDRNDMRSRSGSGGTDLWIRHFHPHFDNFEDWLDCVSSGVIFPK